MKSAADFRSIARDALRGKWGIAVVVGLVASLLGASTAGLQVKLQISENRANLNFNFSTSGPNAYSAATNVLSRMSSVLLIGAVYVAILAAVLGVIYFLLSSVVRLGYARFNLTLVDRGEPSFDQLFSCFSHWKTAAAALFLRGLYTLLWGLLLIIPGIMAAYSYAMTEYILSEEPELTAGEALARSKTMMEGRRWELFCLQLSFIGWDILCALTLGIGHLWLSPYKQAATAAFYREVSAAGADDGAEPVDPNLPLLS